MKFDEKVNGEGNTLSGFDDKLNHFKMAKLNAFQLFSEESGIFQLKTESRTMDSS